MHLTDPQKSWNRIGFFLLLTTAISSVFYYLIIHTGRLMAARGIYVTGLMWSPGVAGLIARYHYDKSLRDHGWTWGKTTYQLASYLIPALYGAVVYTEFVIGEFGAGLAAASIVVAYLFWSRRGQLPRAETRTAEGLAVPVAS